MNTWRDAVREMMSLGCPKDNKKSVHEMSYLNCFIFHANVFDGNNSSHNSSKSGLLLYICTC